MIRLIRALVTAALVAGLAWPALAQDLDALAAAARANPRDAAAQTAYGRALLQAERYREADRVLRAALRLHGGSPQAAFDVARVAFAQGDYRRSRAACRLLERRHRGHVLTKVCRARAFLVWNRSGRAFEELEAAARIDPDHFELLLALADAHRLRADIDEAESAYRRAIAIDGSRPEPHYGLGLLYSSAGREADALAELRAAHALDPTDPDINYQLGIRSEGDEARRLLERAVQTRPRWAEALVALAEVERTAGDLDAARTHYEAALELAPNLAAAHIGLGRVQIAQGEAEAGERSLRRALELVPNSPEVALQLGELYENQGRRREAFEHYRRAADLAPANPVGLLRAAALALRLERDVLATGFLDRYLRSKPEDPRALELYGDAMMARGDRVAAQRYYERALQGQGSIDRQAVQQKLRRARVRQQRRQLRRATVGN